MACFEDVQNFRIGNGKQWRPLLVRLFGGDFCSLNGWFLNFLSFKRRRKEWIRKKKEGREKEANEGWKKGKEGRKERI